MSMTIPEFARALVTTGELDPTYNLISNGRAKYGDRWGHQFALHMFMYYDIGQAAALANAQTELDFWHMQNYGYDDFKRGKERRHFRGDKGLRAMRKLQTIGSPYEVWRKMWESNYCSPSYTDLLRNLHTHFDGCEIGPYFAWKAMDILDRCLGMPVELSLSEAARFLPDVPRKCVDTLWIRRSPAWALDCVADWIKDLPAPGAPGKLCGYSEAETVMCAIVGNLKGSYTFGDDIRRRHNELADHPYLLELLPPKQDWSEYEHTLDAAQLPT